MRKFLLFLLAAPLWLACQSGDSDRFDTDPGPLAYNDEAAVRRKLTCPSADCANPLFEEQYQYNAAGQLTRINFLGRNPDGKYEVYSYTEQQFNAEGQPVRKIRYGKYGTDTGWTPYDEYEYEYANGVLKTERQYYNQRNPVQRVLAGRMDYTFKDGKKTGMIRYDTQDQVLHQVAYEYRNQVLTRETWSNQTGNVVRRFEHAFAGPRRRISELVPSTKEQVSVVEKRYDAQGRLASEETTVSNPLLCTMAPGTIRYEY